MPFLPYILSRIEDQQVDTDRGHWKGLLNGLCDRDVLRFLWHDDTSSDNPKEIMI